MKKINNLILICGLIFASYSCEDAMDIEPVGSLIGDVTFETLVDLQLGLNGAYARYNPEGEILINSVFTDNCKPGYDNGGQEINFYNWALTAGDGNTTALWNSNYSLINQCNRVLEAAELLNVDASEQAEMDNLKGQLYTLRAVAHLTLASYFTTDYLDGNALSVIISDRVPEVTEILPRNTNSEIFTFIESDLTMASSLLAATQTDNKYISQDFVTGLKARMALLQNDSSAIGYAQTLIDSYSLANQLQYSSTFLEISPLNNFK